MTAAPFTLAPCVVCGAPTMWACSDCAIEGKGSVHICNHEPCRDQHEHDNPQHPVAGNLTLCGQQRTALTRKDEPLAPGCCSAASPCDHQKRSPYTLCEVCQQAAAITRNREGSDG